MTCHFGWQGAVKARQLVGRHTSGEKNQVNPPPDETDKENYVIRDDFFPGIFVPIQSDPRMGLRQRDPKSVLPY